MTIGKTLFLFVLQISTPENECPFSLDQFHNKEELFTSFSLTKIRPGTRSFLACGVTYIQRDPLNTGDHHQDQMFSVLRYKDVWIMGFPGIAIRLLIWSSLYYPHFASNVKIKKFTKPCFVGDEIENTCSDSSESCHEKIGSGLQLVRLDGIKVRR